LANCSSALFARRIDTLTFTLYASRAYCDRHDARSPVLIGRDEGRLILEASWLD
jgi:hypothetical protein